MDISGHRRFLPTFIPLDPPQNGALQYPGLQIPLDKARKTRVENYPQQRKAIEELFGRLGSYEREFVSCTITGFLVPFVPRISGFRLFGKGLGGLFRNIVVSSLTAAVGAHYSLRIHDRKTLLVQAGLNADDRKLLDFHLRHTRFLRRLVLSKANLWVLPPQGWMHGVHPALQRWIRIARSEVLFWERRFHMIFWTSRMEKAWQEVFAKPNVRQYLDLTWKQYFGIVTQSPSTIKRPFKSVELFLNSDSPSFGTIFFQQYVDSLSSSEIKSLRRELYICDDVIDQYHGAIAVRDAVSNAAERYIAEGGERDFQWEQDFKKRLDKVKKDVDVAVTRCIKCHEMAKVLYYQYAYNFSTPEEKQVLQLIQSNDSGGRKDETQPATTVDDPNRQAQKEANSSIAVSTNETPTSLAQCADKDMASPNEKKSVENQNLQNGSTPNDSVAVNSPSQHDDPPASSSSSETAEASPPIDRQKPHSIEKQNRGDAVLPLNNNKCDASFNSQSKTISSSQQKPHNPAQSQTPESASLQKGDIPVTDTKDPNAPSLTPPTEAPEKLDKKENGGQVKKEDAKNKEDRGVEDS